MPTKGTLAVLGRHCRVLWGGCRWGSTVGVVEGDLQLDLDVPAGDVDFVDDQAQQGLFLGEVQGVDDLEDAVGEVADAAAELVVAGEFTALGGQGLAALGEVLAAAGEFVRAALQFGSSTSPAW